MKNHKVFHAKGTRPAQVPDRSKSAGQMIPENWIIFNAPRPIYASFSTNYTQPLDWVGDFIHGIFYTAVDPADQRLIALNTELDAWEVVYHTAEEAVDWAHKYYPENYPGLAIDWNAFSQEDFDSAFYSHLNKDLRK